MQRAFLIHPFSGALLAGLLAAADTSRQQNTVILDETGVKNLGIETVEVAETTFEETVFALGRIEVLPGKRAVVSSRIPGRAYSVLGLPDQPVAEGAELVWVESRQFGDPPPTVMLSAPMAGIIAEVNIAVGQPVTPDQSLMEIVDLSVVEASARVPEHLASKLKPGLKALIRVPGFPDTVFEAELAHLGAYADGASGTLEAAFHVPNPDTLLRPEMRAEFNIVISARENVMAIPRSAVQGDLANRFVYVKDFDLEHAFVRVPVVLGAENHQLIEVKSGLMAGDEVVTRGGYSLAFAGKGSVSLKEALDAAHGHPHNEDGSEIIPEQAAAGPHDHQHTGWSMMTTFFAASTAVLLVLLILGVVMKSNSPTA